MAIDSIYRNIVSEEIIHRYLECTRYCQHKFKRRQTLSAFNVAHMRLFDLYLLCYLHLGQAML